MCSTLDDYMNWDDLTPRVILRGLYKGVYPQRDGGLVVVGIDASKGFVDLWVHLTFAIFANFNLKKQLKWLSTKISHV